MKKPTSAPRSKAPGKQRRKTREELNQEARDRKRDKKHRGHAPGSRASGSEGASGSNKQKPQKDPQRWGKPFSALLGAFAAQKELGVAAIGGKDSMSGTFEHIDVPPTLVSFAVTTENGKYTRVKDLPIDAFSQAAIDKTLAELEEERSGVAHLL